MTWRAGLSDRNWIDHADAIITASAASLTAPVTNVTTYEAGVPWIAPNLSLTDGECSATIIYSKAREIGCAGFIIAERRDDSGESDFEPYVAATDLVRWKFSSTDASADGDVYDSANHPGADGEGWLTCNVDPTLGVHGLLVPRTGTTALEAIRCDFYFKRVDAGSPPLDVARFGRLWNGPFREFETNHDWGSEVGWDKDDLDHDVRVWAGDFNWIPKTADPDKIALDWLQTVSQQASTDRQVFFWPRSDDGSKAFFARFASRGRFRSRFISNGGLISAWSPALKEDWLGV